MLTIKKYNHKKYSDFALHYCLSNGFNYVIPGMMEIAEIKENIKINKIKKNSKKNLALIYYEYKKIENDAFVTKKQKILKKLKTKKNYIILMGETILIGPSGFLGPAILKKYPKIIAVGRSKPPFYCKNKFIKIKDIHNLKKLDNIKIKNVIYLVGNSNHHKLNQAKLDVALNFNFYPLKSALNYFSKRKINKFISFSGALVYDEKN